MLDEAFTGAEQARLDDEAGWFALDMAECYLRFNRHAEALDLAEQSVIRFERCGTPTEAAKARFYWGLAHARLGAGDKALELLDLAAHVFETAGLVSQSGLAALERGSIFLARGDNASAWTEASRAHTIFATHGLTVRDAQAQLVQARAALGLAQPARAERLARSALSTTRKQHVAWLAYESHYVLAQTARQGGQLDRALGQYRAAVSAIEHVQSWLPTELPTNFLADKLHVYHEAIECALARDQSNVAFDYLERSKSRALVDYLARNPEVRLRARSASSQGLVDELVHLREEHNWSYNRLYGFEVGQRPGPEPPSVESQKLHASMRDQERRIGRVLERLALEDADSADALAPRTSARAFTPLALDEHTLLLEYYLHADSAAVFVMSQDGLEVRPLPIDTRSLQRLLRRWHLNLDLAAQALTAGEPLDHLQHNANGTLALLYDALVRPIAHDVVDRERLVIIPYGALHGLPFHALFDGTRFLLERLEVSTCPSSSVLRLCAERRHPDSLPCPVRLLPRQAGHRHNHHARLQGVEGNAACPAPGG